MDKVENLRSSLNRLEARIHWARVYGLENLAMRLEDRADQLREELQAAEAVEAVSGI